eukprot:TRINITY_DN51089_c0_g1_i1.p1 TRINITY_DN51089_c0_g1~~TRINITY_DN51089_c0_g1_i1.p1  ORF type:complete len:508 (-),score=128.09 TRINITY_DN51089_c0_g1_i1:51-1574(-)
MFEVLLLVLAWAHRACGKVGLDSLNPQVLETEYAVRGAVPDRAMELENMIKANPTGHGLPFNRTIQCNIGNPQALGQKPLSFNRQVLSMISNPELLKMAEESKDGTLGGVFKADAVSRARKYISRDPAGVGAYTNSMGFASVREEVAEFIQRRDGYQSDLNNIFITDGASAGVRLLYQAMIRPGKNDGVLVPIPQYPLYSALTTLFDGHLAGYYLDEGAAWGVTVAELSRALKEARGKGANVRALVVINPGNPTGQALDYEDLKKLVEFCRDEKLVLMADEVYQENVYAAGKKFISFKKVVMDMGEAAKDVELVSFHSASKGFLGECGIRGGYFELHNIDKDVKAQLYKLASITLCSNTHGQIAIGLMVNPPKEGDDSHPQYIEERDAILSSLHRRAVKLADALNKLEGISCNPSEGAMYLFPSVHLPKAAVQAAASKGLVPDTFYCLELLEATGIVTVPGSGFKQKDGTYHFRTTFLPSEADMDEVVERMAIFHKSFMSKYGKDEL